VRAGTITDVIRDAVLHLSNEQPLMADLFELPTAVDVGLRCTNLRLMNGKRPVFVDDMASVFFFPYLHIRFIEIPPASLRDSELPIALAAGGAENGVHEPVEPELEAELEIDEDFLRRIREV
jgi:hypothetical protein